MCLNPKYAKFSAFYKPNGKRDIVFVGSERRFEPDTLVIPCGKCDECKLDYAREWSVRCQAEASLYDNNYFVTLTYDPEHLPPAMPVCTFDEEELEEARIRFEDATEDTFDPEVYLEDKLQENRQIGCELHLNPLVPQHFSQFVKSLRQYYKRHYNHDGIRFFGCGEYGSRSLRPHYHLIIFNLPIYDLQVYKKNNGNTLFVSEALSHIWDKGYVVIGEVNAQSCGYVARYNYKKQIKHEHIFGIPQEFVRMSRRPGIGFQYFVNNYEKLVKTQLSVCFNGREYRNVSYFSRLMCGFDLDTLRDIKHYSEVENAIRDRSLDDYDLVRNRNRKDVKQKLLKIDNISLDNNDVLLYINRVKKSISEKR